MGRYVTWTDRRSYGQQETQQLLRPSLLRPEELSMESGIDPGQDYYTQDYYNYDQGYDHPQYGSRRKLISPSGLYDEYGEVVVDDDGSYYYSPQESDTEHGHRKRRIKLTVDREYETSSTGDDSQSEHLRSRLPSTLNSHTNVNGGLYVAQNGSIIRTRRSVAAPTQTDNKPNSPVFSSRLTKHFKKLDKTACTPDEELPLSSGRSASDRGCNTLSTFKSPAVSSEINKTLTAINTRQSTLSLGSTNNSNTGQDCITIKLNVLKGPHGVEQPRIPEERDGVSERESKIDVRSDATEVTREPLECPSDRTQSDEEELWMGPWNNLHIPMTKL